ncbi:hypothetical protein KEM54_002246, partial [Ascosphaera aggregata]
MGSRAESPSTQTTGINGNNMIPKSEPQQPEASCESSLSTPDPDGEIVAGPDVPAPKPKRKGGRKPIYATSEERKQRNRQAQAAFRERRTEYIKQLESTIKQNEETLQTLHQSHRSAADECLMLRYKNSLLERILLEKGIDVQSELRMKSFSNQRLAMTPMNPSPMARSTAPAHAMGRRKIAIAPKGEQYRENGYIMRSPQLQPTPPSGLSSPSTTKSPAFGMQSDMSSAGVDMHGHHPSFSQSRPPLLPHPAGYGNAQGHASMAMSNGGDMMEDVAPAQPIMPSPASTMNQSRVSAQYYLPPFQKHYAQLDQEYDAAHNDMVDEDTHHYGLSDANHFPHHTYHSDHQQQQQQQHPQQKPPDHGSERQHGSPIAQPGPGSVIGSRYEAGAMHSPLPHPQSQQQHLQLPLPHATTTTTTAATPTTIHPAGASGLHNSEPFGGSHGLRATGSANASGPSNGPFFEHFDP